MYVELLEAARDVVRQLTLINRNPPERMLGERVISRVRDEDFED